MLEKSRIKAISYSTKLCRSKPGRNPPLLAQRSGPQQLAFEGRASSGLLRFPLSRSGDGWCPNLKYVAARKKATRKQTPIRTRVYLIRLKIGCLNNPIMKATICKPKPTSKSQKCISFPRSQVVLGNASVPATSLLQPGGKHSFADKCVPKYNLGTRNTACWRRLGGLKPLPCPACGG